MRHRIAAAALAIGVLSLVGCSVPGAGPSTPSNIAQSESPASPAPSGSSTPTTPASPSPSGESPAPAAPVGTIPRDCRNLVSPQVYATTFGETPLNDPAAVGTLDVGVIEPSAPPSGADASEILSSATQLECIWRDPRADVSYLEARVATVDGAFASGYLGDLAKEGYTCTDVHDGRRCQSITRNEMYPVDDGDTHFLRGDIYVHVRQSNVPTDDLIGAIAAQIWR